jgi:WD40 repeat protein
LALALLDFPAAAQLEQPRLDRYGDPLPPGTVLRIGTVRLRTGGRIDSLAFTADGKKLVTANRTTGIHVWDVASGKEMKALPSINKDDGKWYQPSPFAGILLSPGGAHVAEVNNKSICSVREIATGDEIFKIDRKHWQNLCHFQFAPDGKTLALLANMNGEVTIYEVATGKLLHTLPEKHNACYPFLAFSPDGKSIAVAAQNIPVIHYDIATGKRLGEFSDAKESSFNSGVFSPDGKLFALLCKYCSRVEVWEVATHKHLATLPGAAGNSHPLTFSPDSRWIIAPQGQSELGVWDARTGKLVRTQSDRFGGFWHTAVSPDGKYLATAHGQLVELWHLDSGKRLHDFAGHAGHDTNVQFGTDSKSLITISHGRVHGSDTSAFIWDAATGKKLADVGWAGGTWPVGAVSADGRVQAQGRGGEKIVVRELATKKVLLEVDLATFVPNSMALSGDGKRLLVTFHEPISGGSFKLELWDVERGKKLLEYLNNYSHASFDAAGRHLLIHKWYGKTRELQCYEVTTGRPVPRTLMSPVPDHRVVYSPSGRLAAEVHWDGTPVKVRESATGQVVAELGTGGQIVVELAFSPNGRLLAAGTLEGAIFIWDVVNAKELAHLPGHRCWIRSLSWAPDGTRLASGSQDMTILVWNAEPWHVRADPPGAKLTPQDLATLWDELGTAKGNSGYRAAIRLWWSPEESLAVLRQQLRPTTPQEVARVRTLIENLGDAKFSVRTKALLELEKLGDLAIPGLQKALEAPPTLETRLRIEKLLDKLVLGPPPAAHLQQLRALMVLEMIGTREAEALLDVLGRGEPDSWLTREARAAKERLPKE